MNEINFIGIGAAKAGTTWLYQRLKELPEVKFTPIKELHYFSRDTSYNSSSNLSSKYLIRRLVSPKWIKNVIVHLWRTSRKRDKSEFLWMVKYYFSNYTEQWYLSLFDSLKGIKGEFTPAYAILELKDIKDMYRICPKAKIIFLLRDPIERAWSEWKYFKTQIKTLDEIEIIPTSEILEFMNSKWQIERSNYYDTIRQYAEVFPAKQILIAYYDAIIEKPQQLMMNIASFIGADNNNVSKYCNLGMKENESPGIEMPREIYIHLKEMYEERIAYLATMFGGYPGAWHAKHYGKASLKSTGNKFFDSFVLNESPIGPEKGYVHVLF